MTDATLRKGLLAALLMSLAACSSTPRPSTPVQDGAEVRPLEGWLEYCRRNPGEATCPSN